MFLHITREVFLRARGSDYITGFYISLIVASGGSHVTPFFMDFLDDLVLFYVHLKRLLISN